MRKAYVIPPGLLRERNAISPGCECDLAAEAEANSRTSKTAGGRKRAPAAGDLLTSLPARHEPESELPPCIRALEWIRVVGLKHNEPEDVHTRRNSGADNRNSIVRAPLEGEDGWIVLRPRHSCIHEQGQLRRQVREVDQTELLCAEHGKPHLRTSERNVGTVEPLDDRAAVLLAFLDGIERGVDVSANESGIVGVPQELHAITIIGIGPPMPDVQSAHGERHGVEKQVSAIVRQSRHEAG